MTQNGVSVVTTTWNERSTMATLILRVRTVLRGIPHEIILMDDESLDGAVDIARRLADVTVRKKKEGQTMGLLHGARAIENIYEQKNEVYTTYVKKQGFCQLSFLFSLQHCHCFSKLSCFSSCNFVLQKSTVNFNPSSSVYFGFQSRINFAFVLSPTTFLMSSGLSGRECQIIFPLKLVNLLM